MLSKRIYQTIGGMFVVIGAAIFAAGFIGHPVARSDGSSGVIGLSTLGGLIIFIGVLVFVWTATRK
jgi:hypothetical protein